VEIQCPRLLLRPWRRGDEPALVKHADNRKIWRNLRDRFPHPYTSSDAEDWIRSVEDQGEPTLTFAIVLDGEPVGAVGLERFGAEIGYWLSETRWGKGFATEAVIAASAYAFAALDIDRLHAGVFEWNPASCRVLEKAGFRLEARLRKSVFKDGRTIDRLLYVRFR
jgi:ribosomal-protein-alanine N-acetyltransferase